MRPHHSSREMHSPLQTSKHSLALCSAFSLGIAELELAACLSCPQLHPEACMVQVVKPDA
eukprot:1057565-Pelagomonas_calceolata.AAC.1